MDILYRIFGHEIASLIPHFDLYTGTDTFIYHNRFNNKICIVRFDNLLYRVLGMNQDIYIEIHTNTQLKITSAIFNICSFYKKENFNLDLKLEQEVLFQLNKNESNTIKSNTSYKTEPAYPQFSLTGGSINF